MEEAYDDPSKMTIATGCQGSRVVGSLRRCTFLELCDYLWTDRHHPDGTPYGDEKPDPRAVKIDGRVNNLDRISPSVLTRALFTAKEEIDGRNVKLSMRRGYIGGVDGEKLIGESDWYRATEKVGDSLRNAAAACNSDAKRAQFGRFPDLAAEGSKLVVDLRIADSNEFALGKNGLSKYAGGRYVYTKRYDPLSDSMLGLNSNTQQPDRETTIEAWQESEDGFPALSKEDATELYDRAVQQLDAADGNRHKMAIQSAQEAERRRTLSC
ncbi:hypothetical protein VTK73DRAFT_8906 [Phialemonium thermophilum]|uniref:Uncharacterized protein n=1 Tax=Phialemonium thermophilum TaxID=223376 RepID=A0ABR3W678_9PEZI